MRRINHITAQTDKHGTGKPGFTIGEAASMTPPTVVTTDWCDDVQEEICNAVEDQGATLGSARTQLSQAIKSPKWDPVNGPQWLAPKVSYRVVPATSYMIDDGGWTRGGFGVLPTCSVLEASRLKVSLDLSIPDGSLLTSVDVVANPANAAVGTSRMRFYLEHIVYEGLTIASSAVLGDTYANSTSSAHWVNVYSGAGVAINKSGTSRDSPFSSVSMWIESTIGGSGTDGLGLVVVGISEAHALRW